MLTTWDAVSTLDRMFDDVMGSALGTATNSKTFEPAIDVRASESEVVFLCDVPGVKQEDLEVTLENHVLTIKGRRKYDSNDNEQVMLGRAYGAFTRAYTLPDALDEDNLSAHLADGVLTVRIPK
ncbi:MAG: Hsp20/alpha crystallin family protein, partial [Myxococcota bacterium]|nr:Hsp20/alpha crystallin family protein [Myxococcota bacterium]